mmetsp:Transcript_9343/g.28952  ORF Transcript_9343/g.28952 Transcript_9343/m.28952 type:complete len:229 (-) Transcript_9343:12-698(-)
MRRRAGRGATAAAGAGGGRSGWGALPPRGRVGDAVEDVVDDGGRRAVRARCQRLLRSACMAHERWHFGRRQVGRTVRAAATGGGGRVPARRRSMRPVDCHIGPRGAERQPQQLACPRVVGALRVEGLLGAVQLRLQAVDLRSHRVDVRKLPAVERRRPHVARRRRTAAGAAPTWGRGGGRAITAAHVAQQRLDGVAHVVAGGHGGDGQLADGVRVAETAKQAAEKPGQ